MYITYKISKDHYQYKVSLTIRVPTRFAPFHHLSIPESPITNRFWFFRVPVSRPKLSNSGSSQLGYLDP